MTTIPMKEVAAFLLGEDSLDGYWFGERHPVSPFWWREHLRAALSAPATAQAAEIERLKTESEERLQNCAALVAENEQLRKDAERYQWLAEYLVSDDESYDDAIVAATTVAELDYVTDAAMKGIEIEPGVFSGCDQSGGDCQKCGK